MGINLGDVFKDNKKILLGSAGILAMVMILGIVLSAGGDIFKLSEDLTGGGVTDLVGNGSNNKKYNEYPAMNINTAKDYTAKLITDYGQIEIDLYEKETSKTVNNFVTLSKDGFYDNVIFHRVVRNFVIQGGDPQGTGTGGPGYTFEDEIDADALGLGSTKVSDATYLWSFYSSSVLNASLNRSVKEFYELQGYEYITGGSKYKFEPYVIAMANSGPNTNGSQFFITTKNSNTSFLDGKHTVFGKVISGFDTVDKIEAVNVNSQDRPTANIKIREIVINER